MAASNPSPAKRMKMDLTEEFIVLVGAEEKRFVVHKDALIRCSHFFRTAVNGNFAEAKEKVIHMQESDPEIFAIYGQWLYEGSIVLLDPEEVEADRQGTKRFALLTRTYILADHVGNSLLQNQLIDEYKALLATVNVGPSCSCLRIAYDGLPEKSKLLKFMLDWYLAEVGMDWLETNMDSLPDKFVKDLALGFGRAAVSGFRPVKPINRAKCEYHVHDDDAPACV